MKNTQDVLMEFITFIKNEALGANMDYKRIEILYDYKYKLFENCTLTDFIDKLCSLPVSDYIDGLEETQEALLDEDCSLNEIWNKWYTDIFDTTSKKQDERFEKFRDECFKIQIKDNKQADELYRTTRKFIIENPILKDVQEIKFAFMGTKLNYSNKELGIDYIKDCYDMVSKDTNYLVCNECGYVKYLEGREIIHRLCNIPKFEEVVLKRGTLIAKRTIYSSIIRPGRFEIKIFEGLLEAGIKARLFPDIEVNGDIEISINDQKIYLDMKSYYRNTDLKKEILNHNGFLEDKYKNRWIIVPDEYYLDQKRELQSIINSGNSRIYNKDDLIDKIIRMERDNIC